VTILLTGATGYIGSHVWIELLQRSFNVVGVDNLSNSKIEVCGAVERISGKDVTFAEGDIRDSTFLSQVFAKYSITHVIHLAALKDAQEALRNNDEYFDVNVNGVNTLLAVMRASDCHKIIFSSSAAVYGDKANSPMGESAETSPANWYGETKLKAEQLLRDETLKFPPIHSVSLRYFNVAGRHPSGLLGSSSIVASWSLFDQIEKTLKSNDALCVFGDDWHTPDGTCVRDYVHVCDIAKGHIDALKLLDEGRGFSAVNLGSGTGRSVKEVISAFEAITERLLPIKVVGKRVGDVAVSYADCKKGEELIGWSPTRTLADICGSYLRGL
jgi:UDP-glucose 4-epimerase